MKTPHCNLGQAMVEFALVIPLIVLIVMGIFDLGRGVYAYNVVASAAREGARFGSLQPSSTTAIQNQARANTVGLAPSSITVTVDCSNNGTIFTAAPCSTSNTFIRVTVTHTFQPITLFFSNLSLIGRSMMAIEP
jgi:Flp pilus assembly protein TadG